MHSRLRANQEGIRTFVAHVVPGSPLSRVALLSLCAFFTIMSNHHHSLFSLHRMIQEYPLYPCCVQGGSMQCCARCSIVCTSVIELQNSQVPMCTPCVLTRSMCR